MATVRKVGLLGAGLMVVGSFLPFASMPIMGSVNYFNNAQGDGIIVVALAAAVIATVLSRRPRWLWLYGIAGAGVLGFDLVNMVANIHEMRRTVETEMQDNMFGGIAVGMANAVQIQIGPAVIGIGIALVCGAAAVLGTIRKNERRF